MTVTVQSDAIPPQPASLPGSLTTPLTPQAAMARLDAAARRGQLAGFTPSTDGRSFKVEAFAEPFDHELLATWSDPTSGSVTPGHAHLKFTLLMLRKAPLIFWAIAIFSVWPGVWLTDSMLRMYFTSYDFPTWVWYLPLTVLPLPFMWFRSLRKSRALALASAHEAIQRLATHVDGTLVG